MELVFPVGLLMLHQVSSGTSSEPEVRWWYVWTVEEVEWKGSTTVRYLMQWMSPRPYTLECTQQALVSGQSCSSHTVLCMFAKGCEYIFHSVSTYTQLWWGMPTKNNNTKYGWLLSQVPTPPITEKLLCHLAWADQRSRMHFKEARSHLAWEPCFKQVWSAL